MWMTALHQYYPSEAQTSSIGKFDLEHFQHTGWYLKRMTFVEGRESEIMMVYGCRCSVQRTESRSSCC